MINERLQTSFGVEKTNGKFDWFATNAKLYEAWSDQNMFVLESMSHFSIFKFETIDLNMKSHLVPSA